MITDTHRIHHGDFQATKTITTGLLKCDTIQCKKIICEEEQPKLKKSVGFDLETQTLAPDKKCGYQYERQIEKIDLKEGLNSVFFFYLSKGLWNVSYNVHITSHEEVEPLSLTLGISDRETELSYSYPLSQLNKVEINPSYCYTNSFVLNSMNQQNYWLLIQAEPIDRLSSNIFIEKAVFKFTRLTTEEKL